MLDEIGDWVVNDAKDLIAYPAASLRDAIGKAVELSTAGGVVRSIFRLSPSAITVFPAQIDRIVGLIDGRNDADGQSFRAVAPGTNSLA